MTDESRPLSDTSSQSRESASPYLPTTPPTFVKGSLEATAQAVSSCIGSSAKSIGQQVPKTSLLAILCLVSAIAGWSFFPVIGAVLAIVLGKMANSEFKQANGQLAGKQLVTIGNTIAIVQLSLIALVVIGGILASVFAALAWLVPIIVSTFASRS